MELVNRQLNEFFRGNRTVPSKHVLYLRIQQYNHTAHETLNLAPAAALLGKDLPVPLLPPAHLLEDIEIHQQKLQDLRAKALSQTRLSQETTKGPNSTNRLTPEPGRYACYRLPTKTKFESPWSKPTVIVDVNPERKIATLRHHENEGEQVKRSYDQIKILDAMEFPQLDETTLDPPRNSAERNLMTRYPLERMQILHKTNAHSSGDNLIKQRKHLLSSYKRQKFDQRRHLRDTHNTKVMPN